MIEKLIAEWRQAVQINRELCSDIQTMQDYILWFESQQSQENTK